MAIVEDTPATAANFNAAFVSKSSNNTLSGTQTFDKELVVKEIATPSTPASGYGKLYFKNDNQLYMLDDLGVESQVSDQTLTGADSSKELTNIGISATVAANALTIALKTKAGTNPSGSDIVKVGMRNATLTTGTYNQRTATGALSLVISSGSTLGHVASQNEYIFVYLIDNAGTLELAASSSKIFDEGGVVTTVAEGGAGAADSRTSLYSTTQRTNVPCRLIGRLKSNQSTPGTWASAISEISLVPFDSATTIDYIYLDTHAGYGGTNTKVPYYTNSSAVGSSLTLTTNDNTSGATITVNVTGIYFASMTHRSATNSSAHCAIAVNSTKTTNSSSLTTTARAHAQTPGVSGSAGAPSCSTMILLQAGDVINPQTDAETPGTAAHTQFTIFRIR